MKKMLFVHDIRLLCDKDGNYYANGSISAEVLNRYLKYADKITIFSRKKNIQNSNIGNYDLLSKDKLYFSTINKLTPSIFIGKDFKKLKEEIKKNDYIVVRMPSFLGIPAIVEARKQKKKCLIEMVGCPFDALWYHGNFLFKFFALPTMLINKILIKNNKYVTYVSSNFLQKRYPCKYNSYSISDVDIVIDEKKLENRLNRNNRFNKNNTIIVGTVASSLNVKYKGQQYVIKAIKYMKSKGYNFEYLIVGSGDNTYLKNLARKHNVENNVKFLGSMPHEKIIEYMENLDIYIQPSNAESHGRVILEAMSTGSPVIGSSTGGIPELVPNEFVFRKKNVKELARKMEKMVNSNLNKISMNNFEIAKSYSNDMLEEKRRLMYEDFFNINNEVKI